MPVTALLLVALAVGLYFWSKSQISSKDEEEAEVVVTRKDSVKKDTINIMRNENAKAKANDDLFKLPEEQKPEDKKKPETEQRQESTTASTPSQETETTTPATTEPAPAAPAATPAPQETTPAPAPAPTTTAPPADNPAPSTVTPRPVIPEE